MFFLLIGVACAADVADASNTEYSNLNQDDGSSSLKNLEVSSGVSISETNTVISHEDNLNYPDDDALKSNDDSSNEDNSVKQQASSANVISSSNNDQTLSASNANTKVTTTLSVVDTHYVKSATYFKVTLLDKDGKAVSNQKVSLTVNGKSYSASTDKSGIASIKTASLAVGSYTVALKYDGDNAKYAASSLSKAVKVLSSVKGSDINKKYGYASTYKATFWKGSDVLANTQITFKVNGKSYVRTTDKNGVAKLNINLAPGKYVITSTNPYSKEKLSNNIVVKKDGSTVKSTYKNTYIPVKSKYTYTVTLKSKHNVAIKGVNVYFKYNGKQVTAKTNKDGKASITIPKLSKGTYSISYNFKGNTKYSSSSGTGKLYVRDSTTKLTSSALKMTYKDGSKFTVKVKTTSGKVLKNKVVKFKINGKTTNVKTNANGNAKLSIGDLKPGTYTVTYSYSSKGLKDYKSGSNKVTIAKQTVKLTAGDLTMKPKDGSVYQATVKDKSGNLLKDVVVQFKVDGKTYKATTDSKGVAKVDIGLDVGYYPITSTVQSSCYKSNTVSKHVLVDGIKFSASDMYMSVDSSSTYSVKLTDAKNNPISGANVKFTFNGKDSTVKTDSSGIAKLAINKLAKGDYTVNYVSGSASGTSQIHVVNKVSLKDLISSSKSVKSYIEKNNKLPSTVTIGGVKYSTAEYLYLASKAIVNLNSNNKADISVVNVNDPTSPVSTGDLGNLYNYLAVAKSVASTSESKGVAPNSASSSVGTIGYASLVDSFARVIAFYGNNNRLPSYVAVESVGPASSESALAAYLAASANCQVNNAQIKELVTKLTKGLTTDTQKANAIFEYVRDTLSYSFYYNTKYGAVGALNAKTGNCVDHSHLLVAMYRTAGIAARYVHGTCTFTSGSTYGHVWSQVYLNGKWVVSDATSSRNSLGKIANWNTNSYKLNGYYASLPF